MDICTLGDVEITGPIIAAIAIGGGFTLAFVSIVGGIVKGMSDTKQREQTKREIAAYVAEGSISPSDAKDLIATGQRPWHADRKG